MKEERRDIDLMRQAKRGSKLAFEWLVNRHITAVQNFFYWRIWDKDQAEDLAQEVFMKLYTALPDYKPQGPFKSYLFSIATNLLIDYFRRQKTRPSPLSIDGSGGEGGGEEVLSLLDKLIAPGEPPEAELEREELVAALQEALDELPQDQYLVFMLHKLEEKKYEEVSEEIGVPVGTVKSRMNAAYHKLREHLLRTRPETAEETESAVSAGQASRRRSVSAREQDEEPDAERDAG